MEKPWSSVKYGPSFIRTSDTGLFTYKTPSTTELTQLQTVLRQRTTNLIQQPYNAQCWVDRAEVLLKLGFPEFVLGDCFKAHLLVDKELARRHLSADLAKKIAKPNRSAGNVDYNRVEAGVAALTTSIKACSLIEAHAASSELCLTGISKYQENTFFPRYLLYLIKSFPRHLCSTLGGESLPGYYNMVAYPWMSLDLFQRDPATLQAMSARLAHICAEGSSCTIRLTGLRDGMHQSANAASTEADCLGVFADCQFQKRQHALIFREPTVAGALSDPTERCNACCGLLLNEPIKLECCGAAYCSNYCAVQAKEQYHTTLCGKDLTSMFRRYRECHCSPVMAAEELKLLRLLAMAVQGLPKEPLHGRLLASMTASYERPTFFSYEGSVARPVRFLSLLGITVFTDHRFDTWALETIKARASNNTDCGVLNGVRFDACYELRSLINHSCKPNVKVLYGKEWSSTTVLIAAIADIKKGEVLVCNYGEDYDQNLPADLEERRELMRVHLGGDCQCQRCVEQEREESPSG